MPRIPFEGPLWLLIILSLLVFIVQQAPRLLETWEKTRAFNREYEQERKRLELLKLRYEIEVLRKEQGLNNFEDEFIGLKLRSDEMRSKAENLSSSDEVTGLLIASFIGGASSIVVILLGFLIIPSLRELVDNTSSLSDAESISLVRAVLSLVGITGISGLFGILIVLLAAPLTERIESWYTSFLISFLGTFLFWYFDILFEIM